ncbi:RidA family protein [bacterium]|nr:RidA family protein [bacterium]
MGETGRVAKPLAKYAPYRRAGDLVFLAGIVAADPDIGKVVEGYQDLPEEDREKAGYTGDMSTDSKEGPIAAQAWYIMSRLQETVTDLGGTLENIVYVTQFFRDLRDFPIYDRIRSTFFDVLPASTVVEVKELLPTPVSRLEVQAVVYLPE